MLRRTDVSRGKDIKIKGILIVVLALSFYIFFNAVAFDTLALAGGKGWQVSSWEELPGPAGGKVTSVDVDPYHSERMFAATPWGLYRSMDQGESWQEYAFSQQYINVVKFHPTNQGKAYLGTYNGLYITQDHGDTWNQVSDELGNQEIYSVDFSTLEKALVLVGGENGVYISEDSGESFAKILETDSPAKDVVVYSPDPEKIYAALKNEGLMASEDRGESWRNIGKDLPGDVLTIEINPRDRSLIHVGTTYGIYRTSEGRSSSPEWRDSGVLGSHINTIWLDSASPSNLLAGSREKGLLKSSNLGHSWELTHEDLSDIQVLDILYHPGGQLFLATEETGILRIEEDLSQYEYSNEGISANITEIIASNEKEDYLLGITEDGIFRSVDGGYEWERSFGETPTEIYLENYGHPAEIIEGEERDEASSSGEVVMTLIGDKIYYSYDWGGTWEEISTRELDENIVMVTVNPVKPGEFWLGTDEGIFVTDDDGENWRHIEVDNEFISLLDLTYSESKEELIVYAGSHSILYKSEDSGEDFTIISEMEEFSPSKLLVNPYNYEEIWLGTYAQGVYYSADGGEEFQARNEGLPVGEGYDDDGYLSTVHTLKKHPDKPGNLVLGIEEGVYFSNSKGEKWEKLEDLNVSINSLAINFNSPTNIYAGSRQGVLKLGNYEIPYMGWEEKEHYSLEDPQVLSLNEEFLLENYTDIELEDLVFKTPSVVQHGIYQFHYERNLNPEPSEIEGSQETLPGNEKLVFEKDSLSPGETWEMEAQNEVITFSIEYDIDNISPGPYDKDSEFYETYTSKSLMSDPTDPDIEEKASEIVGEEDDPLEKAKLIFKWVQDYMEYVPPGNIGASRALEEGEGVCADYSDLFVALSRAEGIPARRVSGYYKTGEEEGQFHAWAEFYLEGYGWIPVEPTFTEEDSVLENFGKLDPNHVFMSFDVVRQEYSEGLEFEERFFIEEVDKSEKGWDKEKILDFEEYDYHIEEEKEDLEIPEDKLEEIGDRELIYLKIGEKQYYVGEELSEFDVLPYIQNNRTMVPLRFIAESLGASVDYIDEDREIEIEFQEKELRLYLEENTALINGKEVELEEKPTIKSDRTMVPLRFINESFGAEVSYHGESEEIFIVY